MAKKKTIPGSIYSPKNCNTLYICFKGRRTATGLQNNAEGRKIAMRILEKKYLQSFNIDEKEDEIVTFDCAWQEYYRTLVQKSPKTITGYLESFNSIVKNRNIEITDESVERAIMDFLHRNKLAHSSVNIHLTQFQIFLNYCARRKWINSFSYKNKYKYKLEQSAIQSYTIDEINLLLNYFRNSNSEFALLIEFMLMTGARITDALNLQWQDISIENRNITWRNKITKLKEPRPICSRAIEILQTLQKQNKRKVFSWAYSSASRLNRTLSEGMNCVGIEKNKRAFQEFRITFRMMLESIKMPEHYIEYLLRHSSGKIMYKHYTDMQRIEGEIYAKLEEFSQILVK